MVAAGGAPYPQAGLPVIAPSAGPGSTFRARSANDGPICQPQDLASGQKQGTAGRAVRAGFRPVWGAALVFQPAAERVSAARRPASSKPAETSLIAANIKAVVAVPNTGTSSMPHSGAPRQAPR